MVYLYPTSSGGGYELFSEDCIPPWFCSLFIATSRIIEGVLSNLLKKETLYLCGNYLVKSIG